MASKLSLALDGIETRLKALKDWADWGTTPIDILTVRYNVDGKEDDRVNNWESTIEAKTQAANGMLVILLQALPNPVPDTEASGPCLKYTFQVDLYHRPILAKTLDPQLCLELICRWLHHFQPVTTRNCGHKLKLTKVEGGKTTDNKLFVNKLNFTWEAVLAAVNS